MCREMFEASPHTNAVTVATASLKTHLSPLESNGWNCRVLDVKASAGCCVRQVEARIVSEHMAGKVASRTRCRADVGHRCHDVAATEVIQLQRRQLSNIPI